jgi:hypothetical protein
MNDDNQWKLRLTVLSRLVQLAPAKPGRTALMKFAYLLQTIRKVPLGYRFELYHYGPYAPDVLANLSEAESLKAIKSHIVQYGVNQGFEYQVTKALPKLMELAGNQHMPYENDLSWVIERFGSESASKLELIATIVYAERDFRRRQCLQSKGELCHTVRQIKPHFSQAQVVSAIDSLLADGQISVA